MRTPPKGFLFCDDPYMPCRNTAFAWHPSVGYAAYYCSEELIPGWRWIRPALQLACRDSYTTELEAICATFAANVIVDDYGETTCAVCGGLIHDDEEEVTHVRSCPVLAFKALLKAGG